MKNKKESQDKKREAKRQRKIGTTLDTNQDQKNSAGVAWAKGYFKNNYDYFLSLACQNIMQQINPPSFINNKC